MAICLSVARTRWRGGWFTDTLGTGSGWGGHPDRVRLWRRRRFQPSPTPRQPARWTVAMHSAWLADQLAESARAVLPDELPEHAHTDCLFFFGGIGDRFDDAAVRVAEAGVPPLLIGVGAAVHQVQSESFEWICGWLESVDQAALGASLREHAATLPQALGQACQTVATIRADASYAANCRICEYLNAPHPARHRELLDWALLLGGSTDSGGEIGGDRTRQVALANALTALPLRRDRAAHEASEADHVAGAVWMILEEANNHIIRVRREARAAIRRVVAALNLSFDVEVRETMRMSAPEGDLSMPRGNWYLLRDSDQMAVCACAREDHAKQVREALGAGFTVTTAKGGEWLKWDREIAAAECRMGQADYIFASSDIDVYSNDDVEEFQAQHWPAHADQVRAYQYLRLLTDEAAPATEAAGEIAKDEGEFHPASWFRKGMAARLRMAARPNRKSKRVRSRVIDGVVCYSVEDARRWWPKDVPKKA
mgnify:CR=1 FL=1